MEYLESGDDDNRVATKFQPLNSMLFEWFLHPASAVEVIKTGPSVCGTLTAEQIDVWSQNLVEVLTLMTSWRGSMVKVIGQRPRSSSQKTQFWSFGLDFLSYI